MYTLPHGHLTKLGFASWMILAFVDLKGDAILLRDFWFV
jgi:hypothetical protein